ncbi:MAG: ROK family protein [Solirubrobacteraceae bacterium]
MTGGVLIGVDVGGTKVSVAAFGEQPKIEQTDKAAVVEQIVRQVQAAAGGESLAAVGVGIPSVVEFDTGRVRSSVNIPLHDVPLRKVLEEQLGCPVYVDNDATVAALAEAHDEQGRLDARHLVMLTVGTGVGGGIVIDGKPFRGATGAAGELGHTLIAVDPAADPGPHFPQPGSLEASASGHVLDALAARAASEHPDSTLAALEHPSGPDCVRAAKAGDRAAIEAVAVLGRRLGIGIANAINTFDPDVVAIGGGVSAAGELLLKPAVEHAAGYVLSGAGTQTEIRIARSGPSAGVRGAALLARGELHHERTK